MILQALAQYYTALCERGEVCAPGWNIARVSFALDLAPDGALLQVFPLKVKPAGAKKDLPQPMQVPEQIKKASGVASNFLCENSSYFLGIDNKGKPQRSLKCFAAARARHHQLLGGVASPAARAVLAFFDGWQPALAAGHPALAPYLEEILAGANLVFWAQGRPVLQDPAVIAAWEAACAAPSQSASMRCLVTGQRAPVARLHPSIKGVAKAQATGASLVSFNAPAFESYGHEMADSTGQGYNAPVSERAAFAYTTALNHLLAQREYTLRLGDTTIVYWAQNADPVYQGLFSTGLFGTPTPVITQADLRGVFGALAQIKPVDVGGLPVDPTNHFYVLGFAPSAARLSVQFFLQDTFGAFAGHLNAHYERLEIVKPAYETNPNLSLWWLLNETANQNAKDKKPPAPMAAATVRAVLQGSDYPASLYQAVMLRIRAERNITWRKAAIIKAYLLKNKGITVPKEVCTVQLNEDTVYLPYVLGRLFAVLEKIQKTANPNINTTIRDKYFTSAAATPASIFPLLTQLSQNHLHQLSTSSRRDYEKMICELKNRIHETLPPRLTLQEQGTFDLGYYHQLQKL